MTGKEISKLFCVNGEYQGRHYYQIMKYYPADLFFYFCAEALVDKGDDEIKDFIKKNSWNDSLEAFRQLGKAFKALDFTQRINLALEIFRALQEIQGKNIIHRDIKPENILLKIELNEFGDQEFDVMISDFDDACEMPKGSIFVLLEEVKGSYLYIAPEVFLDLKGRVTQKTDIYALAPIISQIFGAPSVGHLFFHRKTAFEISENREDMWKLRIDS